jgi:hypothetical protein
MAASRASPSAGASLLIVAGSHCNASPGCNGSIETGESRHTRTSMPIAHRNRLLAAAAAGGEGLRERALWPRRRSNDRVRESIRSGSERNQCTRVHTADVTRRACRATCASCTPLPRPPLIPLQTLKRHLEGPEPGPRSALTLAPLPPRQRGDQPELRRHHLADAERPPWGEASFVSDPFMPYVQSFNSYSDIRLDQGSEVDKLCKLQKLRHREGQLAHIPAAVRPRQLSQNDE